MEGTMVNVKYDEELIKCIQELFINKIVPENFLLTVHKYDTNVLTMADIQRLRKCLESKSNLEVNYELLTLLKNYRGWFEVILNICKDSEVKQSYLVPEFQRLRSELDTSWKSPQEQKKDLISVQIEKKLASELEDLSLTFKKDSDADGGAVCLPPAKKFDLQNRSESSTEDQKEAKEGWSMSNGKGYCHACSVDLSSEKFKDNHITGKNHLKKMKEGGFCCPNDKLPSLETAFTAPDNNCSISEDWIKECKICDLTFTSPQHSNQHIEGKNHKRKAEAFEVKPLKILPTLGPSGEVFSMTEQGLGMCFLCNVSFTSKENGQNHLSGRKHRNMCKEHGL